MPKPNKFPATRAVLELVKTVVDEAGTRQITLANTNDPETVALIEHAVEQVEKAEAERAIRTPPALPQWGERPLTGNERNSIVALIDYQAEESNKLSAYDIEKLLCTFFGVETICELKAWEYDAVMRFLTDFREDSL
jgi:hypothetical protein